MGELTIVKFIDHCPPYCAGEVAGFDAAAAGELIAKGIAAIDVDSLPPTERRRQRIAAAEQYLRKASVQ